MKYISVCSGIEAATVAWHHMGWTPAWFSEIEKFPSTVLAHHYPNVPNRGDMTKFNEWPDEAIDLLVGGTPCQSFSVAGLRRGLADPRGNLMLTFLAIAGRYRPRWIVWENVPGVLSSGQGRDFGTFLGALGDLGYGWAYRVLDAQWFGVAQRRRRVFVVGTLGSASRAAAVLFERESVRRNPVPIRAPREEDPRAIETVAARMRGFGDYECDGTASTVKQRDYKDATDLVASNSVGFRSGRRTDFSETAMKVRRLTPRECERLQGFPDDYTDIKPKGKDTPDGPRYKALGNSMAVPVMRWIGERINAQENA